MKALSTDNYIVHHYAPSLEDVEFKEYSKLNELQKILLMQNRKIIASAIIRIGTMICYPAKKVIAMLLLICFSFSMRAQTNQKQCKGVTKKHLQCKRMLSVNNKSNYCYQHLQQKK